MRIGIPAEVKNHEYRVAITPAGVTSSRSTDTSRRPGGRRHGVLDHRRRLPGRRRQILPTPTTSGQPADMIVKVKEPIAEEYGRLRAGQLLFTYLHLAADRELTGHCWRAGSPGSRTRPCRLRTARCPCWPR